MHGKRNRPRLVNDDLAQREPLVDPRWIEHGCLGVVTDNQLDEFAMAQSRNRPLCDNTSVSHDHRTTRNLIDLIEAMRHVDHADTRITKVSQHCEQAVDVRGRQGCGRFIQHKELRVGDEATGDSEKASFRAREVEDTTLGIDSSAHQGQDFGCFLVHCPIADEPEALRVSQHLGDILSNRHPFDQPEILVNERDPAACARCIEVHSQEPHRAFVRFVQPR